RRAAIGDKPVNARTATHQTSLLVAGLLARSLAVSERTTQIGKKARIGEVGVEIGFCRIARKHVSRCIARCYVLASLYQEDVDIGILGEARRHDATARAAANYDKIVGDVLHDNLGNLGAEGQWGRS